MTRRSAAGRDYPPDWDEIAQATKERAGWACVRCAHPHEPASGHTLTVHHADLDPSNSRWWNLLALCQRCHLSIQQRVNLRQAWMHEHSPWFRPFVAGFFAHLARVRDDRAFVEANIEQLIAFGRGRCTRAEIAYLAHGFTDLEERRARREPLGGLSIDEVSDQILREKTAVAAARHRLGIEVDGVESSRPCGERSVEPHS